MTSQRQQAIAAMLWWPTVCAAVVVHRDLIHKISFTKIIQYSSFSQEFYRKALVLFGNKSAILNFTVRPLEFKK
jgi:hypothetical protein